MKEIFESEPCDTEEFTQHDQSDLTDGQQGKSEEHLILWTPGTCLLGEYEVTGLLGYGGMGTVYLVKRNSDSRYFAVKTLNKSKMNTAQRKQTFLRELRTWFELPDHPNLTACRFFRTIDGHLAIFAEFVNSGSLRKWVQENRITSVSQILDIAIQVGRGLQAAHYRGVIHQDVKSSNILLNHLGIAKVTDFGLSRACLTKEDSGDTASDGLVSSQGMTPAYCSPEQANRGRLNSQTDIWSWGLMILEMVAGQVFWQLGFMAPQVLQSFISPEFPYSRRFELDDGMVTFLGRCFESDLTRRWQTMDSALESLIQIYQKETGTAYPRKTPESRGPLTQHSPERKTERGIAWDNPDTWIRKACHLTGTSESEIQQKLPRREGSRKSHLLIDLEILEVAERHLQDNLPWDHSAKSINLARIRLQKAILLDHLEDGSGAISVCHSAIEDLENGLPAQIRAREFMKIRFLRQKSAILNRMGQRAETIRCCDLAIGIAADLISRQNMKKVAESLAILEMNKANAQSNLFEIDAALESYNRSEQIWKENIAGHSAESVMQGLALLSLNKATAMLRRKKPEESLKLLDAAIDSFEQILSNRDDPDISKDLTTALYNKCSALLGLNDLDEVIPIYNRAIAIIDSLIQDHGRMELLPDQAMYFGNKALALWRQKELNHADSMYAQAIDLYEQLVYTNGRSDLLHHLSLVYMNHSIVCHDLNRLAESLRLIGLCISNLEDLIYKSNRRDLMNVLAFAYLNNAVTLETRGDLAEAITSYGKSDKVWVDLIAESGSEYLTGDLAEVRLMHACALFRHGDIETARIEARLNIPVLREEIEKSGRTDFVSTLENSRKIFPEFFQ